MKTEKTKYTHISIPNSLGLELAKLVGHEGFRSVTEVVLWAIRQQGLRIQMLLDKIEKEDILHDIKEG